jgi:hypothetical protein
VSRWLPLRRRSSPAGATVPGQGPAGDDDPEALARAAKEAGSANREAAEVAEHLARLKEHAPASPPPAPAARR